MLLGESNPCGLVVTSAKETDGPMTFSGQCYISVLLTGSGARSPLVLGAVFIQLIFIFITE